MLNPNLFCVPPTNVAFARSFVCYEGRSEQDRYAKIRLNTPIAKVAMCESKLTNLQISLAKAFGVSSQPLVIISY
jgi:hypothetical protein